MNNVGNISVRKFIYPIEAILSLAKSPAANFEDLIKKRIPLCLKLFAHIHADYIICDKGKVVEGLSRSTTLPYLIEFLTLFPHYQNISKDLSSSLEKVREIEKLQLEFKSTAEEIKKERQTRRLLELTDLPSMPRVFSKPS